MNMFEKKLTVGQLRLHYLHRANEDLRDKNYDAAREDIKNFIRTIDQESLKNKELFSKILDLLEKEENVEKRIGRILRKVGYPEQALILNIADMQFRRRYLERAVEIAWMLAQKERLFEEL